MYNTFYTQRVYNEVEGYDFNKILNGNINYETRVFNVANKTVLHRDREIWNNTKYLFKSKYGINIKCFFSSDQDTETYHYFDVDSPKCTKRFYCDKLHDRIILRIYDNDKKQFYIDLFRNMGINVQLVSDNNLIQLMP